MNYVMNPQQIIFLNFILAKTNALHLQGFPQRLQWYQLEWFALLLQQAAAICETSNTKTSKSTHFPRQSTGPFFKAHIPV